MVRVKVTGLNTGFYIVFTKDGKFTGFSERRLGVDIGRKKLGGFPEMFI